jgi:hypothetical protein
MIAAEIRPRTDRAVALRVGLVRALEPFLDDRRLTKAQHRVLRPILVEQLDDVLMRARAAALPAGRSAGRGADVPPDYRDVQRSARSFEGTAVWASNLYNLRTDGDTQQIRPSRFAPSSALPPEREPGGTQRALIAKSYG